MSISDMDGFPVSGSPVLSKTGIAAEVIQGPLQVVVDSSKSLLPKSFEVSRDGLNVFSVYRDATIGLYAGGVGDTNSNLVLTFNNNGLQIVQGGRIGWGAAYGGATGAGGAPDLEVYRDAADTLAQRRTTNAQTLRVNNTWTSAAIGEWLATRWASNVCYIEPQANGTGTIRPLIVRTPAFTVATLPVAAGVGSRAFVSDADASTFASIVSGGGSTQIPVYSDGTDWRIG